MAAFIPEADSVRPKVLPGALRRLGRILLSVTILSALAATAYWGHTTGWKFLNDRHQAAPTTGEQAHHSSARLAPAEGAGGTRIRFDSVGEVEKAGIQFTTVWQTKLTEQDSAAGEVAFEPSRVARLSARAGGVTRSVMKTTGDAVRSGELLALIDSTEVAKAKADFQHWLVLTRLRQRARDDLSAAGAATSQATVREAEAAVSEADVRLRAAMQTLTDLGLPVRAADYRDLTPAEAAKRMRSLGTETSAERGSEIAATNALPVRSSLTGIVLTADAVAGEIVESGKALFTVVDPGRMRITLHLSPETALRAAAGQIVFFRPDGGIREYPATVVSIGTGADETSRTVPVRAEAENADGSLRAGTLGRGRIVYREVSKALVVPPEAVQQYRGQSVVFVRGPDFLKPAATKAFELRVVRVGGRDEKNVEVLEGLSSGEIVAAKGSGVLLEEFNRLTAGP